jgi:hypothetical protein
MIHGESLLRQNRRVVQGDVGDYCSQAYPLGLRGKGRQKRPSIQEGFAREKGVDEVVGDPCAVETELAEALSALHQRGPGSILKGHDAET